METADERRARVAAKAKKQFIILMAVILGLCAYIAFFTGDRFIEMSEEAPRR